MILTSGAELELLLLLLLPLPDDDEDDLFILLLLNASLLEYVGLAAREMKNLNKNHGLDRSGSFYCLLLPE